MKVRIANNSIRFRLKEPEVNEFGKSGKVTEILELGMRPDDKISFCLEVHPENTLKVVFKSNVIKVSVPSLLAQEWTGTERVGFDGIIALENGNSLKLLVEKDFKCMDGRDEDNVGSYPNPLAEMKNTL